MFGQQHVLFSDFSIIFFPRSITKQCQLSYDLVSVLDLCVASGKVFTTMASGNNGHSGNNNWRNTNKNRTDNTQKKGNKQSRTKHNE